ncbi:polyribonucleotide 5'-hydroxyl-kinase Clp1-like [Pelobates fuscus]|uniref:polyribonucleotide 5'-hydroxyl-kinase Clp1-like n=1 Tax=Pelobates fuscus TaxID=191477 RepID=UPI002FE4D40B
MKVTTNHSQARGYPTDLRSPSHTYLVAKPELKWHGRSLRTFMIPAILDTAWILAVHHCRPFGELYDLATSAGQRSCLLPPSLGPFSSFKLERGSELRIEVEGKASVQIELVSGFAELFGSELVLKRKYSFSPGSRIGVFTWHGCMLQYWGSPALAYVSTDTPMLPYINTHAGLEQMWVEAEHKGKRGPRVLVAGPSNMGKTTLCRLLINYSVRLGRRPTFIDLDVEYGSLSVPGTISALRVERPADVEKGFFPQTPIVFHYGSTTPEKNIRFYNKITSHVAHLFNQQCASGQHISLSGCVINTCGLIKGARYQALIHAALAFEVDLILALGQDRLYNDLLGHLPHDMRIVFLPKSGGVSKQSKELRRKFQYQQMRDYFYGPRGLFYPHAFEVKFSDVHIYKVEASPVSESCIPMDVSKDDTKLKLVPVTPGMEIAYHLMSLVLVDGMKAEESFEERSVAGFIAITGVNTKKGTFSVLSPAPMPLPKCVLLLTDVTYVELD